MVGALWRRFGAGVFIALLSLSLSRLVFYLNNLDAFQADAATTAFSFLNGIRFDAVSTAYLLVPFAVLLVFYARIGWFVRLYYLAAVGAMNLLNCIDAEFFRFIARRSTDDLFQFAFLSNDIFNIGFNLIQSFWYLLLLFIAIMLVVLVLYNKWVHAESTQPQKTKPAFLVLSFIVISAILVVGMRGGFQRIPIGIIDAGQENNPKFSVLELNTSFTILKTFGKPDLNEMEFFAEGENPVSPILGPTGKWQGHLQGKNVVILIVESLASEYMGSLNGTGLGYTPFMDSLSGEGLLFTNAYANGHRSIEGVPACLAALPTLMYEPYITSRFAMNRFSSLPNLLEPLGYSTYFLHGGENGTMGLSSFAHQAGFQKYLGCKEYPYEGHHDKHWGIFDHHYLKYTTEVFSQSPKPFMAGLFTLSSHHPYTVPQELKGKFPLGTLPIHESIGYADYSLKMFFEEAKKTDWYANTLFVITADHTSLSDMPEFQTKLSSLSIPILYFCPGDSLLRGKSDVVTQQIDIMPSVLSLVGYDKPYFCLGQNVFDSTANHIALAFKFDQYQILQNGKLLSFDGEKSVGFHDVITDPFMHSTMLESQQKEVLQQERMLKGYLQNYSKALVQNKMTLEAWQGKTK